MDKIYVTGPNGRLGSQLVSIGAIPFQDDVLYLTAEIEPDSTIINCAALTDVDRCEMEDEYYCDAIEVNYRGPVKLAETYPNSRIIHISTDYVFGGKHGPYSEKSEFLESDLPSKRSGYAVTKFAGEMAVRQLSNVSVIRTTGLYGSTNGNDFLKFMLDWLSDGTQDKIFVTNELRGNNTYIPHLAEALMVYANSKQMLNLLHIASREVITRYEFALMIASVFGFDKSRITPCKNSEVPGWVAERPKKGGLKVGLAEKLGIPIYSILEGLEEARIRCS